MSLFISTFYDNDNKVDGASMINTDLKSFTKSNLVRFHE